MTLKGILVVETASGLRFEGSAFWVRHRHREFGPFDYEWSRDMLGIELANTAATTKFQLT